MKRGARVRGQIGLDRPREVGTLTSVVVEVGQRLLVGQQDVLVLGDDLPPQVLPAGRQLSQLLQLTHPGDTRRLLEEEFHL